MCVGQIQGFGPDLLCLQQLSGVESRLPRLGLVQEFMFERHVFGPPTGPAKLQRGLAVSGAGSLDRMETRAGRPEILRTKAEQARKPEDQGP